VAWAKQDPTRVDIDVPEAIQKAWSQYERALKRYGKVLYGIYRPMGDHASTIAALTAMLDVLFQERGYTPLKEFENDAQSVQSGWFEHLMPFMAPEDVVGLLNTRRYVVIQGPPGTGKTRMARQILAESYAGNGQTIQFHPNTTYENFVGGLAPLQESAAGDGNIGFRFAPKPGFLIEAAARSSEDPTRNYLLHIDEINRADLGKILGEAIYLFEPDPESRARLAWRTISARLSSASCSFRITSTCSAR
jgi:5-methylcytosine-specific restriction protein B